MSSARRGHRSRGLARGALQRPTQRERALTMTDKLHLLSATELLSQYRRRKLSPVEVTRAVLDQISRRNPELNAFAVLDAESALRDASASEARWQASKP